MILSRLLPLLQLLVAAKALPANPPVNEVSKTNFAILPADTLSPSTIVSRDYSTDHPIQECSTNHLPPLHWYYSAVGDACANLWDTTPLASQLSVTRDKPLHWDQSIPTFDNRGVTFRFKVSTSLDRDTLDPPRYFSYADCLENFGYQDNSGILEGAGLTKCYAKDTKDVLMKGGRMTLYPAPKGSEFVFRVDKV